MACEIVQDIKISILTLTELISVEEGSMYNSREAVIFRFSN
jgi:hypothetical protein